ncbi:hypothetical protein T265_15052, partial [Opisthorchis viverrini]
MVKRSNSLSNLNQLLTISVRLVHYVELHTKDQFTTPVFQYRLEQHLISPWREPKKPVKAKLLITYTSLILSRASWWPYRVVERTDFGAVERCMAFPHVGPFFAVGIRDDDFAEKQFVVMTTKTLSDLQRVMHVMEAQLAVWRNANTPQPSELSPPSSALRKCASQHNLAPTGLSNQIETPASNVCSSVPQTTDTPRLNHKQETNGDYLVQIKRCECPPKWLPRLYLRDREQPKHSVHIHCEPEKLPESKYTKLSKKAQHAAENAGTTNRPTQGNRLTGQQNSNEKDWEVDVKYIRYDPRFGNVLDTEGSVYLYTAHQVRK